MTTKIRSQPGIHGSRGDRRAPPGTDLIREFQIFLSADPVGFGPWSPDLNYKRLIIEYVLQDVSEALDSAGYEIDHGNPM